MRTYKCRRSVCALTCAEFTTLIFHFIKSPHILIQLLLITKPRALLSVPLPPFFTINMENTSFFHQMLLQSLCSAHVPFCFGMYIKSII